VSSTSDSRLKKMYLVLRIDTRNDGRMVHAVCVAPDFDTAYRQMLMEVEYFYEDFNVIVDEKKNKSFQNKENEVTIDVSIIETIFIDW